MGYEITTDTRQTDGTTESRSETRSGNSSPETGGENTRTGGRAGGRTTSEGTTDQKEVVGIPVLNKEQSEEQKRLERNAKRRERYAQQKAENGGTVKPRKVNGAKKQEKKTDSTNVKMVIGTISSMIASRPNMAHWQLTPTEIDSLANPLTNIFAESEMFQNVSEHSDAIALVTACVTVLLPRIVLTATTVKKEKKKNVVVRNITEHKPERKQTGEDFQSNTRRDGHPTTNDSNVNQTKPYFGECLA